MRLFFGAMLMLWAPRFNWAARKLTKRLDQLGASTFIDGYEADEQFDDG